MSRFILILFIISIYGTKVFAQKNPVIDEKTFFVVPGGKAEAVKDFKIAERYYRKGKGTYDEALKHYLKVFNYNDSSLALNYKIGICYLWTSNKKASLDYLLKSGPEVASDYYLALGRAYQYNLSYAEAKEAYSQYLASLRKWQQNEQKETIAQLIAECDNSARLTKDTAEVFIINLGPVINTYYDDYGAWVLPADSLIYFTSKRPEREPKKRVSRFKFKEQLLVANNCINNPCEWVQSIEEIGGTVNISLAGIDYQEKRIYFYKGKWQNGKIHTAVFEKGKWRKIKPVRGGINHIAYKETTISIADDGSAYFVSDRRGGLGGKDIWMAPYIRNQRFGKAKNLGSIINTAFDEEGVAISRDGNTLYYSSNGLDGMGGFDVYKSIRQPDSTWSQPINLGYPINSPADELFYHPTADTMVALYSTIRENSYGGLDIYKIQKDPRIPFNLIGSVTDLETGNVIPAQISIYNNLNQQKISAATVDSMMGMYMIPFKDTGNFSVQIEYPGYKSVNQQVENPKKKHSTVVFDAKLDKLRHPFTLIGTVTDMDTRKPVSAAITFTDSTGTLVYGRITSDDSTGQFSITFDDKYDFIMNVDGNDYFAVREPVNATLEPGKILSKEIGLKRSKIDYSLVGVILDEDGTTPVAAALSLYLPGETQPFKIMVSDSLEGKYAGKFEEQGPFLIEVEANGYFFLNETYQFPEGQTYTAKNFTLKRMSTGSKIVIKNILFNTGKSTLKPESFKELDKLVSLLEKNPKVRIEVSGHTDNIGSASINKKISKERALTVKNYLVSRGIEQDRIEYQGYGFDQPIAPNDTPEGREQNRRVEIKVLQ